MTKKSYNENNNMGKLSLVRVLGYGPGFLEGTIDNR